MDVPAHGHVYEEEAQRTGLHSVIEGGEEEHHEKKSVLKKVKEKAKKIKDTIGKKTHGHGEEHPHGSEGDEEEDEEEDGYVEDDDKEQDPEVHGAPMYESEAGRCLVLAREEGPAKEGLTAGRLEEDPGAPKAGAKEAVPGSYQTSVSDTPSTGGPEPGVIRSFEALSVSGRPEKEKEEAKPERPGIQERDEQPHGEKSYTEKISSATSAIVDKAAHAKEAAVSAAVGSAEYGKKIAETVYEKIAGAGASTVSQTQQPQQQGQEVSAESAGVGKEKKVSMREYLAEKLSPGEEDRALCEVISEAVQKRKEEERDVREEEAEEKTATASGEKKAGEKGVVGKIKGAVTSLLAGSHAQYATQARGEAVDSSRVEQEGGRRLQESSN